jgi:hypothetical protein
VLLNAPSGFYRLLTTAHGAGSFKYPGRVSAVWTATATPPCSGSVTGQLRVHEFELGAGVDLTRLALDLVETCSSGTTIHASARFNSSIPYPD